MFDRLLILTIVILTFAFILLLQRAYLRHKGNQRTFQVLTKEGNYWTWIESADSPEGQDLVRRLKSRS